MKVKELVKLLQNCEDDTDIEIALYDKRKFLVDYGFDITVHAGALVIVQATSTRIEDNNN